MAEAKAKWLIALLIIVSIVSTVTPEIHRAKAPRTKIGSARYSSPTLKDKDVSAEESLGWEEYFTWGDVDGSGVHSRATWVYSLVAAGLVGLSGIFPLLVIPLEAGRALRSPDNAARLKLLLSFAVGGLLGDVFLHLLPEAWARVKDHGPGYVGGHGAIGLWVVLGLLVFLLIEKAFPDHDDEEGEACNVTQTEAEVTRVEKNKSPTKKNKGRPAKPMQNGSPVNGGVHNGTSNGHIKHNNLHVQPPHAQPTHHIKTCGWLNLAANIIDNFTHGLAVAGSFCISYKTGMLTTAAILLHEVPHEIGDFAILLRAGFDRWEAAKAQLLTATGGLLGAFTALAAESAQAAGDSTAWVLPFTSGGFLYIALVSVVPDLLKEEEWRRSLQQLFLLGCGISVMAAVTLLGET